MALEPQENPRSDGEVTETGSVAGGEITAFKVELNRQARHRRETKATRAAVNEFLGSEPIAREG